jgi:hypothetical protein
MTRAEGPFTVGDLVISALALLAVCLFLVGLPLWLDDLHERFDPQPPAAVTPSVIHGAYAPLAVYDPKDRALTIEPSAPRELLICIRAQCKLAEEWVGR